MVAELERPDGKAEVREFTFWLENGRWLAGGNEGPRYRSLAMVEFRPRQGDTLELLELHSTEKEKFWPALGREAHFQFIGEARSPEMAQDKAKSVLGSLKSSLEKAGLLEGFKVVTEPALPAKPAILDEPPEPSAVNRASGLILVEGEVSAPSTMLPEPGKWLTLRQALTQAGEIRQNPYPLQITVLRENTDGDQSYFTVATTLEPDGKRTVAENPNLEPGDRVTVRQFKPDPKKTKHE